MRRWTWIVCLGLAGCPGPDEATPDDADVGDPQVPDFEDDPNPEQPVPDARRRPLEEILREVEKLAVQGPDYEDPLRELHRLQTRPKQLMQEVTLDGGDYLFLLCQALEAAQAYPEQVGFRERRAFVGKALGRVASHDPDAVLACLLQVDPADQRRVAEAASAEVRAGWSAACARGGHAELGAVLAELR